MNIANLILSVQSSQVGTAAAALDGLSASAGRAEKATDGLKSVFAALMGVVTVAGSAATGLKKLVDTTREFEDLQAQLKTATGSAENASLAFDELKKFATETPYALNQSVEAFVRLVNLGLNPSQEAMRSYGNTASAMGRDMTTMVQAVANATTGEFEMLKQFGIKSKLEGDKVSFTFRGVTTEVENSAKAIETYFIKLGQTNFAGAMDERMKTLGGSISNLGDAWDQMWAAMGAAGGSNILKDLFDEATTALKEFTAMLESGQATKYLEAFASKFSEAAKAAKEGFRVIYSEFLQLDKEADVTTQAIHSFFKDAFFNLPENVTAAMRAIGASFGLLYEYAAGACKLIADRFVATWDFIAESASNAWEAIKNGSFTQFVETQKQTLSNFVKDAKGDWKEFSAGISITTTAWENEVTAALNARDASLAATRALVEQGRAARKAFDEAQKSKAPTDLGGFKVVGGGGPSPAFLSLQKELMGEEEAMRVSYEKRKAIIMEGTRGQLALRQELMTQLDAVYAQENQKRVDNATGGIARELEASVQQNMTISQVEQLGWDQRQAALEQALATKKITEQEFQTASAQSWALYQTRLKEEEKRSAQARMAMNSQLLSSAGTLADQLYNLAEEGSGAQKAAFFAAKAIAIGQAYINTELAATRALAEGGPYAGPGFAAALRAMGYASIGIMAAQTIAGVTAHEHGGMIPAGRYGLVGETGVPELVRGPAIVSSARTTAGMLGRGSGGGSTSITINNHAGAEVTTKETEDENGNKFIEFILMKAEEKIASNISRGTGKLDRAMRASFGLNRGNANGF